LVVVVVGVVGDERIVVNIGDVGAAINAEACKEVSLSNSVVSTHVIFRFSSFRLLVAQKRIRIMKIRPLA
jgi:hypothetical protein